ncbi:molybdenum cofactor biosynthesis protein MoaA [Candidatus Heimdallarchaeota archaeon B3_Heim]|nr:MAG: molybdenum cofactor biosynthesis protein MoaA [Candidatus Heimdallarchaeota archaeon B3_Heim]
MQNKYQRFLIPGFRPFDPLELAKKTEKIVTRTGSAGLERKYVSIYSAPVYGGIATGYAVGCCLRCIYCWGNWSRDFPETYGSFHSPEKVAKRLFKAAEEGITAKGWQRFKNIKIEKLRLSGSEPTLGKEHLLALLPYIMTSKYSLFILETNGILLGNDLNYVKQLAEFKDKLYVRVSFKAATPETFTQVTGAIGKYFKLPFKALKSLLDEKIYTRAAAMTDPRVMSKEERNTLIEMLEEIDPSENYSRTLEEEQINGYDTTMKRLTASTDKKFAEELTKRIKVQNMKRK